MKRSKGAIWSSIVLVGLPLGYFVGGHFQEADRPESALHLFEKYCVPLADGGVVDPDGELSKIERSDGLVWVHLESLMLLRLEIQQCEVSDALQIMTDRERKTWERETKVWVENNLIGFESDDEFILNSVDAHHLWVRNFEDRDQRRSVLYFRFAADSESETSLIFSYPKNDDVSENLHELRKGS